MARQPLKNLRYKTDPSVDDAYSQRFLPLLKQIEHTLDRMTSRWLSVGPGQDQLLKSLRYSLLSGGKRFRPILACVTAQAVRGSLLDVMPWACALEFVHCYSLIHDDLPCMDNDDVRRGQPSNHKVYGEGMAMLAGDGLLTEAFGVVAESYAKNPAQVVQLIQLLTEASGLKGMVGGQALDISSQKLHGLGFVQMLHEMKTGALIRAAAEGAVLISESSDGQRELARRFGSTLGFAFQLQDDLLDFDPQKIEPVNFANVLGVGGVKNLLEETSQIAMDLTKEFPEAEDLQFLIQFNQKRNK